jgi:CBS domain-containing protein
MLTVVVANTIARRVEPDSLYSGWLRRRGESISPGSDRDVLAGLKVRDVYEALPRTIKEDAPMAELLGHLSYGEQPTFPVIDVAHHLVGVITVADLGRLAADAGQAGSLIRAADVAQPSEVVSLTDSLLDAVRQMGVRGVAALPVVERGTGELKGLITRGHVMTAYERRVATGAGRSDKPHVRRTR